MEKYNKLKAMTNDELDSYLDGLDEDEQEELFTKLVGELNESDYSYGVYEDFGCYFILGRKSILEMSSDSGDSPRGGFLDIVTGLSKKDSEAVKQITDKLDKNGELEDIFYEIYQDIDEEFDDDDAIDLFECNDDEDNLKLYKKLMKAVKNSDGVFESVCDFAHKYNMRDLEEGTLYYEWEGEYIDLFDNVNECGEARGTFEDLSTKEWILRLLRLDNLKVTAD